jgi:two-component system, chemotaxis family, protein-glutamate methylesterase/glutaminase
MMSLPDPLPVDGVDALTGVACPDCAGTLFVRLRKDFAAFGCRIGHMYSLPELLAAKEDILERRLWIAFSSLSELADLLDDLRARDVAQVDRQAYQRRSASARQHATMLRSAIEAERPLRMDGGSPDSASGPLGAGG